MGTAGQTPSQMFYWVWIANSKIADSKQAIITFSKSQAAELFAN